jgi:hypothetical protein
MLNYYITSVTGWFMIVVLLALVMYPFLLKSGIFGPVQPFLKRMRVHYWLGYTITALMLVHAMISMSSRLAIGTNQIGLYLATGALLLIFLQVTLGLNLSSPKLSMRRVARRWHFWVMVGIVVFVLGHTILNSGTLQMLIFR